MNTRFKSFYVVFTVVLSMLLLSACGTKQSEDLENKVGQAQQDEQNTEVNNSNNDIIVKTGLNKEGNSNPLVTIEMENGDRIYVELYPDIAPNTVNNYISLIEKGYFDGLSFHRVIPNFMIQGGDPLGNGTGGPGYTIKGEFNNNDFENQLTHERGVISMARSLHPDSAGSQFFILVAEAPHLDGDYAAFGKVLYGMEAVDTIVNVPRDRNDMPIESQIMKSISVDTFGVSYPEPDIIKR